MTVLRMQYYCCEESGAEGTWDSRYSVFEIEQLNKEFRVSIQERSMKRYLHETRKRSVSLVAFSKVLRYQADQYLRISYYLRYSKGQNKAPSEEGASS